VARLFQAVLEAAGIPCVLVFGLAKNWGVALYHMKESEQCYWNMAYVDGEWKYFDVSQSFGFMTERLIPSSTNESSSHSDTINPHCIMDPKLYVNYKDTYFNLPQENFNRDHFPLKVEAFPDQVYLEDIQEEINVIVETPSRYCPYTRQAFEGFCGIKRGLHTHGVKVLFPEAGGGKNGIQLDSPFFSCSLAVPKGMIISARVVSLTQSHPFRLWTVYYSAFHSDTNFRRADVNLVFPRKGHYWVMIQGKPEGAPAYQPPIPLCELLFFCPAGIFNVVNNQDVFVGHLAASKHPSVLSSHFFLTAPLKGYFLLNQQIQVKVACDCQAPVERVVISNNGDWVELKPRHVLRGTLAGLILWEGVYNFFLFLLFLFF